MKNKLIFLLNSIKQSVINKPIAFALLIIMFFVTTICCSMPSRMLAGGVNEEYSTPDGFGCSTSVQNFREKHTDIGNVIREKRDGLAFDEKGITAWLSAWHYGATIKVKGSPIELEGMNVVFAVTDLYGITEEDITSGKKVITIRKDLAMDYGIEIGDTINVYGGDYVVQEIVNKDWYLYEFDFVLPYNISIEEWYSCTPPPSEEVPAPKETSSSVHIKNVKHASTTLASLKSTLKKMGYEVEEGFNWSMFVVVILVLAMLVICLLSSISIMSYWLKCNSRKYATYKTLGCSPTMLAITMIIETMLMAIFAIGLGLIADYAIGANMKFDAPLGQFVWLHYLTLIGGPLVGILAVTVIAVIRRAKATPANSKFNG